MKFIKVLPEGLIDRIAAGEVIENPASVVKELIENSIDASAKNIEISIVGGGKEEILIVDDGEGIPKDQVELAFYRHATSKIKSWDDLLRTFTMGFRGEAMPSISSVSIMELSTAYAGEKTGTSIKFEGGKQVFLGPAPPRQGCSISVRNLFYNVPARRKFLKSDSSERRKIADIIRRYIIAHPEISFKVSFDGQSINSIASHENYIDRLRAVWGQGIATNLVEIDSASSGPLKVGGYLSKPETNRSTRSEIFFFVNKRPVIDKTFFGALSVSYGRSMPPGRHPFAAVYLDIDANFIDINVHPAKTEVRFADEGYIFSTLKKAFDKTLALPASIGTQFDPKKEESPVSLHQEFAADFNRSVNFQEPPIQPNYPPNQSRATRQESPLPESKNIPLDGVFQLYDTFIIANMKSGTVIIDQHTAHERILFEKYIKAFSQNGSSAQKLLFEERVKLNPEDHETFERISEYLTLAGFETRAFGVDEIIISGTPPEMDKISPQAALLEVLGLYSAYVKEGREMKNAIAAAVACKAAVKAGQKLSNIQMTGLIDQLLRCDEPYRCPHGRPTIISLNREDLEKIFRRK